MKKAMKVLGVLASVLLVAMITVPFFVKVDRFRPEIVRAVNERIQGKFELGQLSLTLWGRIHVRIDGLKLADAKGVSVISVKDAAFDMPFLSVLSGSPLLTFSMREPEIAVVKDKAGRMNLMDFLPKAGESGTGSSAGGGPGGGTGAAGGATALPALALNARLGLSIENAKVAYRDEGLALTNTVDRLNLKVKDLSLSRKTEAELWAELNTRMGTDLSVQGPLRAKITLAPEVSDGSLRGGSVAGSFSADELQIEKGDLFRKKSGVPAHLRFDAALGADSLKLKESLLRFHNAEIRVTGEYSLGNGADFQFQAEPIDLKPWSELVPLLKEYELEGRLTLSGGVKGKPESIGYWAKTGIEKVSAKGPRLKAKPVLNGNIEVQTDRLEKLALTLTAPGNSLELESRVVSFAKPQVTFRVSSSGMDLDQWVEFPAADPKIAKTQTAGVPAEGGSGKGADSKSTPAAAEDLDALLAPLRKNPMAAAASVEGTISLGFLKAMGFRMDDLQAKLSMRNLVASVSGFRMKMFDGTLGGNFSTDLKPAQPTYALGLTIQGLDLQKAVESQFAAFKNTLTGKLSAAFSGSGASFNTPAAKKNLVAKGDFRVANGAFQSIDVAKMANEAITGSLGKIAEKVPLLKGRDLKIGSSTGSKYELISGTFTIKNGILEAPDFLAKAAPKAGIDLKGYTKVGLLDESIEARWELADTQRVTGADRLSVDIGGRAITNFLAKSEKDPVILPITVGCKWSAPCTSYTQVPEYLAGVAAGRLTGAAKEAAKEAVKQKVQEQVKDVLKKNVGDALKGLFGR